MNYAKYFPVIFKFSFLEEFNLHFLPGKSALCPHKNTKIPMLYQ